jgi:hypothetical protein
MAAVAAEYMRYRGGFGYLGYCYVVSPGVGKLSRVSNPVGEARTIIHDPH